MGVIGRHGRMAEFQEVMKQAKRMCDANCEECPLHYTVGPICPIAVTGNDEIAETERIVMNWAAEHPEPRYPTWEEWQKHIAPNATHGINPCAFMSALERDAVYGVFACAVSCAECRKRPIPSEIAEKLGIKPIGGKRDEET
jgi:hypothetical protein